LIPLIPGITWLEAAMMGRQNSDQASLFYAFRLDDRVPNDHLLRRIDVFVMAALGGIHARLKPYYSEIGRPSIDPELMIRMLIIGYCYGFRFERRLTQEVDLHLAYRWFCRLDLDDKVPHHSTFSENRLHRFRESDVFRHIFERIVIACMAAGLVKGEGFAVDASVMEANASRYHGKAPDEMLGFFRRSTYWFVGWRRRHASNRANSRGRDLLLSPVRSTLFSHAFAAIQDRQQYRKMKPAKADFASSPHRHMDAVGVTLAALRDEHPLRRRTCPGPSHSITSSARASRVVEFETAERPSNRSA
jgi:transposase